MKMASIRDMVKTDGSDTEPDEDAKPTGAGPRGRGPPLEVGSFEKRRELVDGAGLCSLGKWAPAERPITESVKLRKVRPILWEAIERLQETAGASAEQISDSLASGKVDEGPFGELLCGRLRGRPRSAYPRQIAAGFIERRRRP